MHGDVGARTTDGRRRHNARIARRGYLRAENPVQVANDLSGSLGAAHPMATLPKSRSVQPFVAAKGYAVYRGDLVRFSLQGKHDLLPKEERSPSRRRP